MDLNRFDLVIVDLDPTVGSEMQKTRPCVVVSPNEANRTINTVVVIPLTSRLRDYPSRVPIETRIGTSHAAVEQIRSIDKSRISKNVGSTTPAEAAALTDVIRRMYVD